MINIILWRGIRSQVVFNLFAANLFSYHFFSWQMLEPIRQWVRPMPASRTPIKESIPEAPQTGRGSAVFGCTPLPQCTSPTPSKAIRTSQCPPPNTSFDLFAPSGEGSALFATPSAAPVGKSEVLQG